MDLLKNLEKLIRKKQTILIEQLNFGACDASISTFKLKIKHKLPESFYSFYRVFNGSIDGARPIWGKMKILPLSGIINEKKRLDVDDKSWNENWVPFLFESESSCICIDLNPNDKE